MERIENRVLVERILLAAAVGVIAAISIPAYISVHRGNVAVESTVDRRADAKSMTGIPYEAKVVASQAIELERALFRWAQTNGAQNGTEVTFAEIAPFLAGNSHVRALNGVDECGGKWGPFHVGEYIYPCESTKARFADKVKPDFWEEMEGEMRL
jgi:hypothetical protein